MAQPWIIWTLAEAGARTVSRILQKLIGVTGLSIASCFFATAIIGLVQTTWGWLLARKLRKKLLVDKISIEGSILFGFFAVMSTVLGISSFVYGGDIGVTTFIMTLSIIPGALIDWKFFGHPLNKRQVMAIIPYLLAGYSMLGFPNLTQFLSMPFWVWLAFGNMLCVSINQGLTQAVRAIDPFVKNFWVGLTTVVFCLIALIIMNRVDLLVTSSLKLWYGSAITGLMVVVLVSLNLMSYKAGATIALKKLIMQGSYLIMATLLGAILYDEPLGWSKLLGIVGFILAYGLMDNSVWNFVAARLSLLSKIQCV